MKPLLVALVLLIVAFPTYAQSGRKPETKRPVIKLYGHTNERQPSILERRLETTEVGAEIKVSTRFSVRFGVRNDRMFEPLQPQPNAWRRPQVGIIWHIH